MVFSASREWRDDVLTQATQRFEFRLQSELAAFRVDVTKEFAAMRVENLRWSFTFWITQLAAIAALLTYMT